MTPRVRATPSASFKLPHRGWLFDLDATVYRGEALIPGAAETIAALRAAGRRVAFLSNKPLDTRAGYAEKLTRLGIPAVADDVINSSLVLARHLRRLDPGAPVFVIGEPPLVAELRAHGFEVRTDARVRWVAIAFDRTFDYAKLCTALQAVRGGAPDRDQPRPDAPDRGGRNPGLRGHDRGRRGGDGRPRRGHRRQAVTDHPRGGARAARPAGARVRDGR